MVAWLLRRDYPESELRQLQRQPHPLGPFFSRAAPRLTQPILARAALLTGSTSDQ